jgi:cysteine desulfurase
MDNKWYNYFDYAASCPPYNDAMREYSRVSLDLFGNPSSAHTAGVQARKFLEKTRTDISSFLGMREGYLLFTSGCTEANNFAIRGIMERHPGGRLALAGDVHSSAWFASDKYADRVDILPINSRGVFDNKKLNRVITPATMMCSVVHGNNETGVIHDINTLGQLCRKNSVLLHCDGAQTAGHMPVELHKMPFDFYSISAHKFGGPRGVGGLFVRNMEIVPQIQGGKQENDLRAGTENVAGAAAALTALCLSINNMEAKVRRLRNLSKVFLEMMDKNMSDYCVNSDVDGGLPGIVSMSFTGVIGSNIVVEMDLRGYALSAGSACHSGEVYPSRVIRAMGRPGKLALGTVRVSMGRYTDEEQVLGLASGLIEVVNRHRALG